MSHARGWLLRGRFISRTLLTMMALALAAGAAPEAAQAGTLFAGVAWETARGLGGSSEQPPGGLVTVDEAQLGAASVPSGASSAPGGTTLVADVYDTGGGYLLGLDFAPDGRLFASTCSTSFCPEGASELLELDPDTGAASNIGFIREGTDDLNIYDLAFHPDTGVLYGISDFLTGSCFGCLYTIDLASGQASRVGEVDLGLGLPGGLAFTPDGTLYLSTTISVSGFSGRPPQNLLTLDPSDASVLAIEDVLLEQQFFVSAGGSQILVDSAPLQGLASRPDGTLVATGDFGITLLYERVLGTVLDPAGQPVGSPTHVWRVLGDSGENLADLAFQPVPEPGAAWLLALVAGAAGARRVARSARP